MWFWLARDFPLDPNRNLLRDSCPLLDRDRVRPLQRDAIRLERSVGPVALVFHLEYFAGELDVCPDARGEFMSNCRDFLGRLVRRNQFREVSFRFASGDIRDDPGSASRGRAVKHAESNSIPHEGRLGHSIESEHDLSIAAAGKRPMPAKVDVSFSARRVETQREVIALIIELEVGDLGPHGPPELIANRRVDAPQNFVRPSVYVSQKRIVRVE